MHFIIDNRCTKNIIHLRVEIVLENLANVVQSVSSTLKYLKPIVGRIVWNKTPSNYVRLVTEEKNDVPGMAKPNCVIVVDYQFPEVTSVESKKFRDIRC